MLQQPLLFHFIQDVFAKHASQTQLAVTYQSEHEVHQLPEDVLRQLHHAETDTRAHTGQLRPQLFILLQIRSYILLKRF